MIYREQLTMGFNLSMGGVINPEQKVQANAELNSEANYHEDFKVENDYDMEVIEVSNIALAIRNKEHTINVELSLRCENLPATKAFGSTDSMIVIYKSEDSGDSGMKNFMEIGRTQTIYNQLNPKYIKTFIFPFKGEKNEELTFKAYHIQQPLSDNLHHQKLIGAAKASLYNLVESEKGDLEWETSKGKAKAKLKYNCTEYDGISSQYEVGIELVNFSTRSQVYYIIQAWKYGEWIPVARSESKKASKFKELKVPVNKFQGEDNSGVKIKVYESDKEEEIGCTKQFCIVDIFTDQKTQSHRIYQNGFIMGTLVINKWKKIVRDSFISYIVGGARLHLLLAIDFTNSNNSMGSSLHALDENGQNSYINAIREIVGVLQYFSLQNRVALYGFGAKLPPYYKSVSQCFALNGNYFNPNVSGGVEEIIRIYKENLKKIQMHGPTKISEILELAIKYASDEENMSMKSSSTYYVLLILTDGKINDYDDTVDLIVKASPLPLSILFVGLGDSEDEGDFFETLRMLDSDTTELKSTRTGKTCERDIVDFIKISDFSQDQRKEKIARQTFAEIPNQFIDYMINRNIKPSKEKKSLKTAKAQFIAEKIKSTPQKVEPFLSSFLEKEHKEMKKKLVALGFSSTDPLLQKMEIAMNDLSYFIEIHSQGHKEVAEEPKFWKQTIDIREVNKLEEFLEKKDQENKNRTLAKLQKIESNHYGRKPKPQIKKNVAAPKKMEPPEHPCVMCKVVEINIIHMECGHVSVCKGCANQRCPVCYHVNYEYREFYYDDKGNIKTYCDDSDSD